MTSSQSASDSIYNKIVEIMNANPDRSKNILIQIQDQKMTVKFNRPKRYNAFTIDMYLTLTEAIKSAQLNQNIKFIVLMGEGGNFSSGNDLSNFTDPTINQLGDFPDVIKASSRFLKDLTEALIKCTKPIIALTEGKTIGFAFTMLALLDKVFSVENSTFIAPLVSSAQGPQLCASFTFPKIFGRSITEQIITFGKPVKAEFLEKFNFLQTCKSHKQAEDKIKEYLEKINQLQWYSYLNARRLYKQRQEKILLEVAEREIQNLVERWLNPNLITYIGKHMQRMKKSARL